ncbi:MAG: hypothetical protein ABSE51_19185 [Terracidiphilus sp.]|jgi:Leucine-rich repeat (LRR) protein
MVNSFLRQGRAITIAQIHAAIAIVLWSAGGWAQGAVHQASRPQSAIKSLTINEQNASELNRLKEYPNLEVLSISCLEDLQALPEAIGELTHLKEFRIENGNGCIMNVRLPKSFGKLHSLQTLVLQGAMVHAPDFAAMPNDVRNLPTGMSQLKNVTELNLSADGLTKVPDFVAGLAGLQTLDLTFNWLSDLPRLLESFAESETG